LLYYKALKKRRLQDITSIVNRYSLKPGADLAVLPKKEQT